MIGLAFIRNKFVPLDKATIPAKDMGFQRSYGITDVLRSYRAPKEPLHLEDHLRRIKRSAKLIGLAPPSGNSIKKIISQGLRKVRGEILIKVIITGGEGDYLVPRGRASLYVFFLSHKSFPAWYYSRGIKLLTASITRVIPEGKFLDYLPAVAWHNRALKKGYQAVLAIDLKNRVLEGTTFNFAMIKNRTLVTPRAGILEGITMEIAARLARQTGLKVTKRDLKYEELKKADEAFITSTNREIVPVISVDKMKIGKGSPGAFTKILMKMFREYAADEKQKK